MQFWGQFYSVLQTVTLPLQRFWALWIVWYSAQNVSETGSVSVLRSKLGRYLLNWIRYLNLVFLAIVTHVPSQHFKPEDGNWSSMRNVVFCSEKQPMDKTHKSSHTKCNIGQQSSEPFRINPEKVLTWRWSKKTLYRDNNVKEFRGGLYLGIRWRCVVTFALRTLVMSEQVSSSLRLTRDPLCT
jgi:hypothetical protein